MAEDPISSKEEIINFSQISLRPIELSDVDDLMVWLSDEKVSRLDFWEPYTSKEDGIRFINNIPTTFAWYKVICLQNRAIGSISMRLYSGDDKYRAKTAEIGYSLGSKYWGKGIATHAVKEVIKTVFTDYPHLERLGAETDLENIGSQRVLEKSGFQKEGVLRKYMFIKGKSRDVVIYSLLPSDLQS